VHYQYRDAIARHFLVPPICNDKLVANSAQDLQSFTLSRFAPSTLDRQSSLIPIFSLNDITTPLNYRCTEAICLQKKCMGHQCDAPDCANLQHWSMASLLVASKQTSYSDLITLKHESSVGELSRQWNDLGISTPQRMLHTTNRLIMEVVRIDLHASKIMTTTLVSFLNLGFFGC
jgi:hypothetical protein